MLDGLDIIYFFLLYMHNVWDRQLLLDPLNFMSSFCDQILVWVQKEKLLKVISQNTAREDGVLLSTHWHSISTEICLFTSPAYLLTLPMYRCQLYTWHFGSFPPSSWLLSFALMYLPSSPRQSLCALQLHFLPLISPLPHQTHCTHSD